MTQRDPRMAVVALDTHAVVKELQAAGFTEAQAEAVTRAVRKAQDLDLSHLATKADLTGVKAEIAEMRQSAKADNDLLRQSTKADIDALRQATRADIDALRQATGRDIAELKADLLKWMVGTIGVQTIAVLGALVALLRMLPR